MVTPINNVSYANNIPYKPRHARLQGYTQARRPAEDAESRYEVETVVRGYHVYIGIWNAAIGETLECEQEGKNIHNPYAAAVVKGGNVVGHVPRAIPLRARCPLIITSTN